eukprot:scaffold923_cov256-Pinguiococcus_pyrenoidosus.AAC.35
MWSPKRFPGVPQASYASIGHCGRTCQLSKELNTHAYSCVHLVLGTSPEGTGEGSTLQRTNHRATIVRYRLRAPRVAGSV